MQPSDAAQGCSSLALSQRLPYYPKNDVVSQGSKGYGEEEKESLSQDAESLIQQRGWTRKLEPHLDLTQHLQRSSSSARAISPPSKNNNDRPYQHDNYPPSSASATHSDNASLSPQVALHQMSATDNATTGSIAKERSEEQLCVNISQDIEKVSKRGLVDIPHEEDAEVKSHLVQHQEAIAALSQLAATQTSAVLPIHPMLRGRRSLNPFLCLLPCLSSLLHVPCIARLASSCMDEITYSSRRDAAWREMSQGVLLPLSQQHVQPEAIKSLLSAAPANPVLSVHISHTDVLPVSSNLRHPLLRIHFLDLRSGQYWKKSDIKRDVIMRGEVGTDKRGFRGDIDYIPCVLTQPYNLSATGYYQPRWQESLCINEPLSTFLSPFLIIFFELLEFGPSVDLDRHSDGFLPLAWAFLRLIGTTGLPNMGALRLQLYRYNAEPHQDPQLHRIGVPGVYHEWIWQQHVGRRRYDATLYIDISSISEPQQERVIGTRPLLATQIEEGRLAFSQMYNELTNQLIGEDNKETIEGLRLNQIRKRRIKERSRQPNDSCFLPNHFYAKIPTGPAGSFVLRFSPDGLLLAVTSSEGKLFNIGVYEVHASLTAASNDCDPRLKQVFRCHHDLIYDLNFSTRGDLLASCSSDGTVKVWQLAAASIPYQQPLAVLSHGQFVYCVCFHPKDPSLLLSGSYDGLIRLWRIEEETCILTLAEHRGFRVNCLLSSPDGTKFFSGDGQGNIKVWHDQLLISHSQTHNANMDVNKRFICYHSIPSSQVLNTGVVALRYHSHPERLIAFTDSNFAFIFSLHKSSALMLIQPAASLALLSNPSMTASNTLLVYGRGSISPDAKYICLGNTDGRVLIYSTINGRLISSVGDELSIANSHLSLPSSSGCLSDIVWSPSEHVMAVAYFERPEGVRLFEYKPQQKQDINL